MEAIKSSETIDKVFIHYGLQGELLLELEHLLKLEIISLIGGFEENSLVSNLYVVVDT